MGKFLNNRIRKARVRDEWFLTQKGGHQMDTQNKKEPLTQVQMLFVEACVRMVLSDLLNRDEITQMAFEGILHNLNVGVFGKQPVQLESTSWLKSLDALRDILCKINSNETKEGYRLLDEKLLEEKTHAEKSLEAKEGG